MRVERIGDAVLYLGDCLHVLPDLELSIDALITDPPYSSGGQFRGDRTAKTVAKYVRTDTVFTCREEFSGDNRDQRAFLAWSTMWLSYSLQRANPGAVCCVFTDWRQLPTMTDAIQCGGWVWRNLVTWWKPGIRMQRGRFSSSAEYIVYGSNGVPSEGDKSPQNVLTFAPVDGDDKDHVAQKPELLLDVLCGVTPNGSTILDPFMGSGTTGAAAIKSGRKFVGMEIQQRDFEIACERITNAHRQRQMFEPQQRAPEQQELTA